MNTQILAAIGLVTYLVLAWIAATVLQLSGNSYWIFQGLMLVIGLVAALIVFWFNSRKTARTQAKAAPGEGSADLDLVLRNAEGKLKLSKLGRSARLANLPAVVVLGERDSTKTTIIVHSGIESELLAGQVYRDNAIVPTDSINCWFAKGTIFIEAAGKILGDASGWSQLIRRLKSDRLGSVAGGVQASRAAIVCVSCEDFLQPGASAAAESLARKLRSHLDEIASRLGIRLPVYVLFTKADRIPFFTEYVRNFSNPEVAEVVGATLPMDREQDVAIYAERAGDRIGTSFRNLVFALADKRPDLLSREYDAAKLVGVYEFPRELAKLRSSMVRFLVDLCRPSQLRTAPFLRGFYFTGVRAVVLDDPMEHRPARVEARTYDADSGATGMFRPVGSGLPAPFRDAPAGRRPESSAVDICQPLLQ